jgi:hypothetical protein
LSVSDLELARLRLAGRLAERDALRDSMQVGIAEEPGQTAGIDGDVVG